MKMACGLAGSVLLIAFLLTAPARPAEAELSHLKCHRVIDPLRLQATLDVEGLESEFSGTGCQLGSPKLFCVPVAKNNVQPPPTRPDVTGQDLSDDYVCYKLRCPVQPPDKQVTDQFGTRMEKRYSAETLCVPAGKAGGSTTTTSTLITVPTTVSFP